MVKYILAALAILATSAKASVNQENFVALVEDPTLNTAAWHVLSIFLNLVYPFVGGIIYVICTYLWDYATYDVAGITLQLSDVLQLLGVGSLDNFFEVFMGVIQKVVILALQDLPTLLESFAGITLTVTVPDFIGVANTDFTAAESNLFDSLLDPVLSGMAGITLSGYVSNGTFNLLTDIA